MQLANKCVFLSQCSYPVTAMFRRRLRWVGRIDAGLRKRTAKLVGTRPSFSKRLGSYLIEIFMQASWSGVDVFYDDLDTLHVGRAFGRTCARSKFNKCLYRASTISLRKKVIVRTGNIITTPNYF